MKRNVAIFIMVAIVAWAIFYNIRSRVTPLPGEGAPRPAVASDGGVPVTVAIVRRRPITQRLTLVGVLRPDAEAAISPKVPARVRSVLVRDGQSVRRGQPLVALDMADVQAQVAGAAAGVDAAGSQYRKAVAGKAARLAEMESHVAEAKSGLDLARARLRQAQLGLRLSDSSARSDAARANAGVQQAQAGLNQAEAGLAQAKETVERLRFLYAHGGIAKADLDAAEAQASIARSQRDAARAALDQAKAAAQPASEAVPLRHDVSEADLKAAQVGVTQAQQGLRSAIAARDAAVRVANQDIIGAGAQVREAEAGHAQAAAAAGAATLTSPIDGIVTGLSTHEGEYAQPGITMMTVVSPRAVALEIAAPASDDTGIRLGQTVSVTPDTTPDTTLDGTVTRVGTVAGADNRTVSVRVRLRPSHVQLVPGTMATAVIELHRDRNAVAVPVDALHQEGNTNYAWVVVDGVARRRLLTLGAIQGAYAEALGGLADGETVIVNGPDTLQTGMRVHVSSR